LIWIEYIGCRSVAVDSGSLTGARLAAQAHRIWTLKKIANLDTFGGADGLAAAMGININYSNRKTKQYGSYHSFNQSNKVLNERYISADERLTLLKRKFPLNQIQNSHPTTLRHTSPTIDPPTSLNNTFHQITSSLTLSSHFTCLILQLSQQDPQPTFSNRRMQPVQIPTSARTNPLRRQPFHI
jgi:hypothetical protein